MSYYFRPKIKKIIVSDQVYFLYYKRMSAYLLANQYISSFGIVNNVGVIIYRIVLYLKSKGVLF